MPETVEASRKKFNGEEYAEQTIGFKPFKSRLAILEELCLEESRPISNLLRVLLDEALIARGKLQPRQKRA